MKKILFLISVLLLSLSLAGCNNQSEDDKGEDSQTELKEFSLSEENITFDKLGQTKNIVAKYGDDVVYDVTYTVINPDVCEVINGVVIAKGNGNTSVNVEYKVGDETLNDVVIVNVASEFSTTINLENDIYNLKSGQTLSASASVTYPNIFYQDAGVDYSSSDESVAKIANDGTITAVSQGIAIITATSKVEITTITEAMGMTMVTTSPATDSITVVIDNEYNASTYADLAGVYEGYFDWQGFGESHNGTNWTRDNLTWVRSISRLTLNEDGSFNQMVLNAKRANYGIDYDKLNDVNNYLDTTEEEQKAIFTGNCYVYNSYTQTPFTDGDKEFGNIVGMEDKGINNFAENGVFAVFSGNLFLCYKGEIKNLGEVKDSKWLEVPYEPFTNMVAMHSDMTMLLKRK